MSGGNYLTTYSKTNATYLLPAVAGVSPAIQQVDHTTLIQNALNNANGDAVYLAAGTYNLTAPLNFTNPNTILIGDGPATVLQITGTFTGSNIINITANYCGVTNLTIQGASTTYSNNPAADAIQITGAQNILLQNLTINSINGWAIQSTSTAGTRNKWTKIDNIYSDVCAKGIHIAGIAANNNAAHVITNCILDQVAQGSSNGDGYFIEDCFDIECSNLECNVSAGSGTAFHIKGNCASIHLTNFVGGNDGASSTGDAVLIETGANGNPSQIELTNCIFETGATGIHITKGTEISIIGCRLETNQNHGINLVGSGINGIAIIGCSFNGNGQASGTFYDLQSSATGNVVIEGCTFLTAIGNAGGGQVTKSINITAGFVNVVNNIFPNGASVFAGLPKWARSNLGYNPAGNLLVGAPGASPFSYPSQSVDSTYYVSAGTVTVIAVDGMTTGLTSGSFRVPAGKQITITYSVAPTVVAYGD